jgi:hypothetical protein
LAGFVEHLLGASPESDEPNVHFVESVEVRVGGQPRVEDQLLRKVSGSLLPEVDETEDLVGLVFLAQLAVGVAEDAVVGIAAQKGETPFWRRLRLET